MLSLGFFGLIILKTDHCSAECHVHSNELKAENQAFIYFTSIFFELGSRWDGKADPKQLLSSSILKSGETDIWRNMPKMTFVLYKTA